MANAISAVNNNFGGKPQAPLNVFVFDVVIDTYATGGVAIDALLNALQAWKDIKLPASSIFAGYCALDADAEGVKYIAEFLPADRKVVLKIKGAGGDLEEAAAGALTPVNLTLTCFMA